MFVRSLNSKTFEKLIGHSKDKNVTKLWLSRNRVQAAVLLIVCCTAALTSCSDSASYITSLFSEWPIDRIYNT